MTSTHASALITLDRELFPHVASAVRASEDKKVQARL